MLLILYYLVTLPDSVTCSAELLEIFACYDGDVIVAKIAFLPLML